MPAISVVIPLYNKASTLKTAIDSALRQDFTDYEVIVIDDGSTDPGGETARRIRDPRLLCIHQENAGVSAARNRGIMVAESPWIAFLDADDVWDTNHLSQLVQAIQGHGVVAAFANIRLASRPARPLLDPAVSKEVIGDYFRFALAHGGYPNMTSATMVHRETALAAGLFTVGSSMGEDVDLWCRLALRGRCLYTGELTATYADKDDNATASLYRSRPPEFPIFASLLPDLVVRGQVPQELLGSAQRYAHFLVLEYARQLLDLGLHAQARHVLLTQGHPVLDPVRYGRRLLRTFPMGRAAFALTQLRRLGS